MVGHNWHGSSSSSRSDPINSIHLKLFRHQLPIHPLSAVHPRGSWTITLISERGRSIANRSRNLSSTIPRISPPGASQTFNESAKQNSQAREGWRGNFPPCPPPNSSRPLCIFAPREEVAHHHRSSRFPNFPKSKTISAALFATKPPPPPLPRSPCNLKFNPAIEGSGASAFHDVQFNSSYEERAESNSLLIEALGLELFPRRRHRPPVAILKRCARGETIERAARARGWRGKKAWRGETW